MTLSQKKALRSRKLIGKSESDSSFGKRDKELSYQGSGKIESEPVFLARRKLLLFGFAAVALFWFGTLHAKAGLELKNEAFQEVVVKSPDGKVERKTVPASMVVPGTEVQYVVSYKNATDNTAGNVAIINPIPKELEYVSASGAGTAEVSVDDGKSYGPLATLTVSGTDGKARPAKPSDVTHVRWRFEAPLKPGDEGKVTFRARLK